MRTNSTWFIHHEEQVQAARAEFNKLWPTEAELMRRSGKTEAMIKAEMFANWNEFLAMRVSEKYPGDLP